MQSLIEDGPETIPVEDIKEGMSPFTFALREHGLPGSGTTDLLLVNRDGDIGLVECKLAANAEIKRKVVGQILEYAAYLWNMQYEDLDAAVERRSGLTLLQNVQNTVPAEEWNENAFRESVDSVLSTGSFHLIIAVDRVNDELNHTINYLNECGQPAFSFHALELRQYRSTDTEVLVPRLYGQIPKSKQREQSRRKKWDENSYRRELGRSVSPELYERLMALYEWSKEEADRVVFGTGSVTGSFTFHYRSNKRTISVFTVYTDGSVAINYEYLRRYVSGEELEAFHGRLISLRSFANVSTETPFPTISASSITPEHVEAFKDLVVELFGPYSGRG